jgi:NAD+ kinase
VKRTARRVGIVANPNLDEALDAAVKLSESLEVGEILMAPSVARKAGVSTSVEVKDMDADMVVCMGGDGTMLYVLQHLPQPIPILGVNYGAVGFFPQLNPKDAENEIAQLVKGFGVQELMRLSVEVNGKELPPALNEAVLVTSRPAKIAMFHIEVDGRLLDEYRADGIVLATPTGSTAYSMSAGGPIVDPRVDATLIVPVAPYKLSSRPWVLPGSSKIVVRLMLPSKHCTLVVDGQHYEEVGSKDELCFTRSGEPALFVEAGLRLYRKVREVLS